jgi:hypothetical protein
LLIPRGATNFFGWRRAFLRALGQGLAGGTDAGFVKMYQKLLNRLPSDRAVVRGLENVPKCIQSLRDDEKENVFAYKMHILDVVG